MCLNIYKNGQLVNTIESTNNEEIYRQVACCLFSKAQNGYKTTIDYLNNNLKMRQVFANGYTYEYNIKDIII